MLAARTVKPAMMGYLEVWMAMCECVNEQLTHSEVIVHSQDPVSGL